MEKLYPSKIDIAVLILFFSRPEQFKKVFEAVRQARPSKLYLYQDGARENNNEDVERIQECRKIAENIDWECEVHQLYQEKNYGCDPSEYMAQKWFFSHEEMGIVLEDDDVPAQRFFPFCKELLEKYKYDNRINMICGMNNLETADWCPYSYLFSRQGSIWGWASWKRVIDEWEEQVPNVENEYFISCISKKFKNADELLEKFKANNESGKAHYEVILGANSYSNSRLNIIPAENMISSVGISEVSTHSVSSIKMVPKGLRSIYNMKLYEEEKVIKHPPFVIEDVEYEKRLNRLMGIGHPLVKFYRKMESVCLRLRYGETKSVWSGIKRKLQGEKRV